MDCVHSESECGHYEPLLPVSPGRLAQSPGKSASGPPAWVHEVTGQNAEHYFGDSEWQEFNARIKKRKMAFTSEDGE